MMRAVAFAAWLVLAALPARADSSLSFQYSRNDITIVRGHVPPALPWRKEVASPGLVFDVEMHDAAGAYNRNLKGGQTGWFNLSAPGENQGVMVLFHSAQLYPLVRSADYAPLDVLMLDESGVISQILPEIKLASLQQDIVPQKPVRAFLFIQGGLAQRMSIHAGDRVESPVLRQASPVIDKEPYPVLKPAAGATPALPSVPPVTLPGGRGQP